MSNSRTLHKKSMKMVVFLSISIFRYISINRKSISKFGRLTVVWLFDQSNSMKDDQKEIRDRLDLVYDQLGIVGTDNSQALLTAVASYGASFQIRKAQQFAVDISFNWTHDSTKYGIRFDAPFDTTNETWGGRFGMVHHNVVWNANGIMIKGDDHRVYHNTAWNNSNVDLRMLVEDNIYYRNERSILANNAADSISTERSARTDITGLFLGLDGDGNPVKPARMNFNGVDIEDVALDASELLEAQLIDPHNFDFRPARGSLLHDAGDTVDSPNPGDGFFEEYAGEAPLPVYDERQTFGAALDLGAYELDAPYYWIPGRRERTASFPIPRDEAGDPDALPVATTTSLIWRDAYGAERHHLYITRSLDSMYQIGESDFGSIAYAGTFEANAANIYDPVEPFATGTWYWRVDAVVDGDVVRGPVWQFTID